MLPVPQIVALVVLLLVLAGVTYLTVRAMAPVECKEALQPPQRAASYSAVWQDLGTQVGPEASVMVAGDDMRAARHGRRVPPRRHFWGNEHVPWTWYYDLAPAECPARCTARCLAQAVTDTEKARCTELCGAVCGMAL